MICLYSIIEYGYLKKKEKQKKAQSFPEKTFDA